MKAVILARSSSALSCGDCAREDRRTTYALLTTEGTQALRRSVRAVGSMRPAVFDDRLTDQDVGDLRRVLGKLLHRLDVIGS